MFGNLTGRRDLWWRVRRLWLWLAGCAVEERHKPGKAFKPKFKLIVRRQPPPPPPPCVCGGGRVACSALRLSAPHRSLTDPSVGVRGGATASHIGAVAQGRVADVLAHRQGQGGDGGLARGAAGGGGEGGPEAAAGKTKRVCRSAPRSRRAGFAWSLWLRSARSGRAGGSILSFCFNSRRGTVFLRTTTRTSTATRLPPSWPC